MSCGCSCHNSGPVCLHCCPGPDQSGIPTKVKKLSLQPGDLVMIRYGRNVSDSELYEMANAVKRAVQATGVAPKDVGFLLLPWEIKIDQLTPENKAQILERLKKIDDQSGSPT